MVTTDTLLQQYLSLETSKDLNPLLAQIGDARIVLLGEASHGTHEYYTWRTAISKMLIEEKNFTFISVEGDWPDCYHVNRFVKGHGSPESSAVETLKNFKRWPTWMWANWEVAALIEWMKEHNGPLPAQRRVGFYGLDVYSLWESMDVIVRYLRKEDPKVANLAIQALRCFEPYEEGHDYARAMLQLSPNCAEETVRLLKEVRARAHRYDHDLEAALNVEMNAKLVTDAEKYYRAMVSFTDESWNVRDTHMVDTLQSLLEFHGKKSKAIVWEHNTHIGDARFTDMKDAGMLNVGQLAREKFGSREGVYIVGFASYVGDVMSGRIWGGEMQKTDVPPARQGSIEQRLHQDGATNKLLLMSNEGIKQKFGSYMGHRAIGVVYQPEREGGNYVSTLLPSRYDALIYLDETTALHPILQEATANQVPETFPFGF